MLDDLSPPLSTRDRMWMVARGAAFVAVIALIGVGLTFVVHLLVQHAAWVRALFRHVASRSMTASMVGLQELLVALVVAGASLALIATERRDRPLGSALARLPRRTNLADPARAVPHLGAGLLLGFGAMSLLMGGLIADGAYHVTLTAGTPWSILEGVLALALAFLAVGFVEEFMFRGYLQRSLTDGIGFWPASLVTSILFGVAHFSGVDTLAGSADVMLYALFACAALRCTGSLWFIIGFHAAWDFTQSALFGVRDSGWNFSGALASSVGTGPAWLTGGTAGPEASVPCFFLDLALLLTALYACRIGFGATPRLRAA